MFPLRLPKRKTVFFLGLTVILAGISIMLLSIYFSFKDYAEDELIDNNKLALASIDIDHYENLTFTAEDAAKPAYVRLRHQFMEFGMVMKEEYGFRKLYAMKVVGDTVRLIVDSNPDNDTVHAAPGTNYVKPPQTIFDVQRDGAPRFVGPYSDEFGSFYSAFSAQKNDQGEVVAIMGTNLEVVDFKRMARERLYVPAGLSVAAVFIYLMVFLYVESRLELQAAQREREREGLRHAVEREKLLMNIGEGVIASDSSGKVIFANKFALDSVCPGSEDCVGHNFRKYWQFTDAQGAIVPDEQQPFMRNGGKEVSPAHKGLHLRRLNGELFPVNVAVTAIGDGDAKNVIVTFRDITAEAEADRMKSDFVGIAAHQLKAPLTGLKWAVEMLMESSPERPAEESKVVQQIAEITQNLNGLVTALLNVTRIESGRLMVEPQPTNLVELCKGVIAESSHQAQEKKQEVLFNADAALPTIDLDPNLIREAYKNLLTNAIKYTPNGGRIDIHLERSGSDAVLTIKDNGFGIPQAGRNRVFGKFYRGQNIISLPIEGTGLGLYFVKQIIDVSGGRIWFESTEGVGSTFHISLPLSGTKPKKGEVRIS